jgi:hypothetical protein
MAEITIAVEGFLDGLQEWKLIKNMVGEEDEVTEAAEAIKAEWISEGWQEKDIRIVKSRFGTFNKKYREED